MEIERYSHVMHISSTVTGKLLPELGVWDVLRAALPAGTVSGAPKVGACTSRRPAWAPAPSAVPLLPNNDTDDSRMAAPGAAGDVAVRLLRRPALRAAAQVRAMQIIDELEASQRGPYGGGIGHVSFTGGMDMALALRTMVIPNPPRSGGPGSTAADSSRSEWTVHLQVGPRSPPPDRLGECSSTSPQVEAPGGDVPDNEMHCAGGGRPGC